MPDSVYLPLLIFFYFLKKKVKPKKIQIATLFTLLNKDETRTPRQGPQENEEERICPD
jgi:hypothetical protein